MTATTGFRPRSASLGSGGTLFASRIAAQNRAPPQQHHQQRQRTIEEPHPDAMKQRTQGSRSEERFRSLMAKQFENISEADEEEMASSSEECSSSGSATSLDGPSPYAIRHEDRPYWYHSAPNNKTTTTTPVTFGVHNGGGPGIPLAGATSPFLSHPLISPKFGRRTINASLNGCNALGGGTKLQRGFSDPVVRRKRSLSSLMDRLSGCSGSFDQLSTDFLNLPPIPEAVPCRHAPHQSPEEEECDEDGDEPQELECCQKELDRCQMGAVKGQRSNSDPSGSTIISSSNFVVAAEGQARLARCDEIDCCDDCDEWTTQSPDLN